MNEGALARSWQRDLCSRMLLCRELTSRSPIEGIEVDGASALRAARRCVIAIAGTLIEGSGRRDQRADVQVHEEQRVPTRLNLIGRRQQRESDPGRAGE